MGEIQSRPLQLSVKAALKNTFQTSRVSSGSVQVILRKVGERLEFLRQLLIFARQHRGWSPFKNLSELWRLLTHIGMWSEILGVLKLQPFDEIAKNNPRLPFKYVIPNYLARSFTVTERAACFLHHYRRIRATLPENVLRQILQGDVTLHEISSDFHCFALTISLPETIGDREGELSLDLQVDGRKIFDLSFTIVPGWVVKSESAEVLLITRIQGTVGSRPEIRLARRAFREFFPRKLLLAALQGIAEVFGIDELQAVCATDQKSYGKEYAAIFRTGYDDFFAGVGMVKTLAGFYSCPIPIKGRPLASFQGRERSRARKRRDIRQQIQSACADVLLGATAPAARSSSGAMDSTPVGGVVESRTSSTSGYTPNYYQIP
jgi:uncharacterized protein VirK/YbjX